MARRSTKATAEDWVHLTDFMRNGRTPSDPKTPGVQEVAISLQGQPRAWRSGEHDGQWIGPGCELDLGKSLVRCADGREIHILPPDRALLGMLCQHLRPAGEAASPVSLIHSKPRFIRFYGQDIADPAAPPVGNVIPFAAPRLSD